MAFRPSDVVLMPFPFRDRLAERARPAVVVSTDTYNSQGDVIVAAITSHAVRTPMDVALVDWRSANLKAPSTVRILLATIAATRIVHHVGILSPADWQAVQNRLQDALAIQ